MKRTMAHAVNNVRYWIARRILRSQQCAVGPCQCVHVAALRPCSVCRCPVLSGGDDGEARKGPLKGLLESRIRKAETVLSIKRRGTQKFDETLMLGE